jgi:hypothetical protein
MRPWLRFTLILTLIWLGLWGFDRSFLAPEEAAQVKPLPTALGPPIPEPIAAPPAVTEIPKASEEMEIPPQADERPPGPKAQQGAVTKPSETPETPSMEEGAPEDLDAGLEEVVEFIEPIGEDTLEPSDVEPPAPKPPDFLEPGF